MAVEIFQKCENCVNSYILSPWHWRNQSDTL